MKKVKITHKQYKTLKENLIKENKFSWDGKYANEEDLNEHHGGEFPEELMNKNLDEFLDALKEKSEKSYKMVEDIITKHFKTTKDESYIGLPSDLETVEDSECKVCESEPTDVEDNQWFSDSDGERMTDKIR